MAGREKAGNYQEHVASYYAATVNINGSFPALSQHITADVCIVGGGFSGVATALELAERGYKVVLLEAHRIGWGASGRNGGQLIRGIGHGTEQFRDEIGQEGIDAIASMGLEAVRVVRDRIAQHDIQCDLKMGYFDAAIKCRHMKELEQEAHSLQHHGYSEELQIIGEEQVSDIVGSRRYIGGLVDMGSGHLHPLNLCIAEARLAEKLGACIFECSQVQKIHYGESIKVETSDGTVVADQLILCGNAYLGELEPRIAGKVLPAGSYIIATEPLPESVYKKLLPKDMAVADMSIALDYFRLSADKRLLFGGMCNYSGRDPKNIAKALQPKMLRVFPALANYRIEYQWGGMLGIGANRMPQIGKLEPNIYYAQAYSGHGVNATHMAGRVIAEAISGDTDRFNIFNRIGHITFPGGKYFRSSLLAAGMIYYRVKDWL